MKGSSKLRMFWNKVLKRLFTPERDEMSGGWRKLRNVLDWIHLAQDMVSTRLL
jgi:hypothetical protein